MSADSFEGAAWLRRCHDRCSEFEVLWGGPQRVSIESLVADSSGSERALLLEWLIRSEIELRQDAHEAPTWEDYRERFPNDLDCVLSAFKPAVDSDGEATGGRAESVSQQACSLEEPRPPREFGNYELLEEIDRGGMGIIYRARHAALNRIVALKIILAGRLASAVDIARFRRETQAIAALDHPGIVPIYEVGDFSGYHFYAMPLIDGENLSQLIVEGPLKSRRAAEIVAVVANTLHFAHQRGIVHRDIKTRNILLDRDGSPKIADFGLAKFAASANQANEVDAGHSEALSAGQILGTPAYMAPEQASGRPDSAGPLSDVYSMGAVLYALLTGRPPFQAATPLETIRQSLEQSVVSPRRLNAEIPVDLETIALKCLSKTPSARYASASELAEDLSRYLSDQPIRARRASSVEHAWRWCRRNPVVSALAAAVLLLVSALAVGAPLMYLVRSERDWALVNMARAVTAENQALANQSRAEQAEREVNVRSYLAQATAYRRSGRMGQRFQSLDEIAKAVSLQPTETLRIELQEEAVAALALTDLRVRDVRSTALTSYAQFDYDLKRFAYVDIQQTGDTVLCEFEGGREIWRLPHPGFAFWHAVTDFTPDGQYLLVTYFPNEGPHGNAILYVWNIQRRERILQQKIRAADVISSAATYQQTLLFVNQDSELCFWDLPTATLRKRFMVGVTPYSICVDSAGRRIAVNDFLTQLVRIFDFETGKELSSWRTNVGKYAMAWSSDDRFLAMGDDDGQVFVWDVAQGKLSTRLRCQGSVINVCFAHRSHLIAASTWNKQTWLWDANTGGELGQGVGQCHRFSRDDQQLGFVLGTMIGRWDVAYGRESRSIRPARVGEMLDGEEWTHSAGFTADGQFVVTAGMRGIWFWNRRTGEEVGHIDCGETHSVLLPENGKGFVANIAGKGLYYWPMQQVTTASSRELAVGPPSLLQSVAKVEGLHFGSSTALWPDQSRVAVVDNANLQILITPFAGQGNSSLPTTLPSQHGRVTSVAVSSDGKWVAAGGWKETGIQVWSTVSGQVEKVLPPNPSQLDSRFWVSFSPDNRWLVCASMADDFCGYLAYRVGTWEPAFEKSAQLETTVGMAFSSDGRLMAMKTSPETVLLASTVSGEEIIRLSGDYAANNVPAALSSTGSEFVLTSNSGSLVWWNIANLQRSLQTLGFAQAPTEDSASGSQDSPSSTASIGVAAQADAWGRVEEEARWQLQVKLGELSNAGERRADLAREQRRIGRQCLKSRSWAAALASFEQALEFAPDNALIKNDLAWLLAVCPDPTQRDYPRALELALEAAQTMPDRAALHNTLGVAQYRMGNWHSALETLTKAEELAPTGSLLENAFFLAMASFKLGDEVGAKAWLERAIERIRQNPPTTSEQAFELAAFYREAAAVLGWDGLTAIPAEVPKEPPK